MVPNGDDGAVSARNTLSFLRTNSTLKSLEISFEQTLQESYVSAFRLEAVKMLDENRILESLKILSSGSDKFEEFLALVSALQLNTTLKTLGLQYEGHESIDFTVDAVQQLVSILMKNYGPERLVPDISLADDATIIFISYARRILV